MIKSIEIKEKSEFYRRLVHNYFEFPSKEIILLSGGNGSGKSSVLKALASPLDYLKDRNIIIKTTKPCRLFRFFQSEDNFKHYDPRDLRRKADEGVGLALRYNAVNRSEGESIMYSIEGLLDMLLSSVSSEDVNTVVLLDEIDSGLSVKNLKIIIGKIKEIVKKHPQKIQFFISFNNPFMLNLCNEVLDVYSNTWMKFESQEKYIEYIINQNIIAPEEKEEQVEEGEDNWNL